LYLKIKKRAYTILEGKGDSLTARLFSAFIVVLISFNIIAVILETVEPLYNRHTAFFSGFEIFSVIVFTAEYILRVWSCNADPKYSGKIRGRIRFALTPMALIDLLAVLPFYLPMVLKLDLRFIRILRLFRFVRILKIGRYSDALTMFGRAIRSKKEELILSVVIVLLLLIISSSLMYFVENPAQPDAFSSIPESMWWGIATLTTVGYGDVYPVTTAGKILGGIIALLGIAMFALPTGILSSAFTEQIHRRWARQKNCPHCGQTIEE